MNNPQRLSGKQVQFRIRDAVLPEPQAILDQLHGDDALQGRVADFTDNGKIEGAFAVVDVHEFSSPVVVPTHCLREVE